MDLQGLLDRARAGDRAAWNDLLGQLRPWVRALVRRRLRQDSEASDFTQEVQLRMDRGFPRFRGETIGQLRAWARTITANLLMDRYRPGHLTFEPLPESEGVAAPAPAEPVFDAGDMTCLLGSLERLPAHYRAVVEGRLFDGLSCAEIARQMGELPGTVRMWCYRAVQQLNQRLGGTL
jgi:RNA polymerase sigma-70 factor (ECF subfamily)